MSVLVLPTLTAAGADAGTCPGATFAQNTKQDRTGDWINGDLIAQNSSYAEGDFVPQRAELSDLSLGTHTFVFTYDTMKSGTYAYDYVAHWSIVGGSITKWADDNPYSPATPGGSPQGSPDSVIPPPATVTVTFEATAADVTFYFDGHLASEVDHGAGNGASSISGAPFHFSLASVDTCVIGNRDNQIQPGAVLPPPTGSITAKKVDDATGAAIDTATFQLWNDVNNNGTLETNTDTKVGDPQSTSNGIAKWSDLPYGDYLVEETAAPAGYTLPDPAYQPVTVDKTHESVCLTFRDIKAPPPTGSITAKKVDDATNTAIDTAKFQLWNDVNNNGTLETNTDTKVGDPQSTSNGIAKWSSLPYGDYLVEETAAPAGYTLPTPAYKAVTVDANDDSVCVTFRDTKVPPPPTGSITVKKHADTVTGMLIDTAKFQLWNDVNGNGSLDQADAKAGPEQSTSQGTVTWSNLPYGKYLVQETVAPAGYTLPTPAYQAATVNGVVTRLDFVDTKIPVPPTGSITVRKHAGTTNGALIDTAKFQLWNDVNGNGALDQADTKAGTEQSTSQGTVTWSNLPYGKYLVQETVAPAGYTLPTPAYQATTVNGVVTLDFVDQPKIVPPTQIDLQVRKHAGTTAGALIDTAKFQLWNDVNASGTLDKTVDTKAGLEQSTTGGTYTWFGLAPGAYLVEETAAPTGYTLPTPAYRAVTLTTAQNGTTVTVDFADQPVQAPQTVNLQVRKHAGSVSGRLIDTATFQLWNDVNGNGTLEPTVDTKAGSTVDTSGGTYTWTDLATGTYLVQEVTAPEGYSLPSPRYQAVTLAAADLGTTVTVDFADAEIAGVEQVRPPAEAAPGAQPAVTGPSFGGVQALPQTGARERNQLLGLLGTAFVALGGGLLLSSRRRSAR